MYSVRVLLDINVLIALLDGDHVHHKTAWGWFENNIETGWATCPITQNGCIRIMSQPGYPNHFSCTDVADHLRTATETRHHEFWSESLSILDKQLIDWQRIVGPKQLTDIFLLALAVKNGGRFVTFDKKITASVVIGAGSEHYQVI